MKTYQLGDKVYALPFKSSGFFVEDARRITVMECKSSPVASVLAAMLNTKAALDVQQLQVTVYNN